MARRFLRIAQRVDPSIRRRGNANIGGMESMFRTFMLAAAMMLAGLSLARAEIFTFTAIPDEDATRLRERFDKVAVYLSKQLAVEVRYIPVKSYSAAIAAFRNNQVQLAWFGGLSGVRARSLVKGSRAIAQGFEDKSFVTYFIAHSSTGIRAGEGFPKSIAGKTFTFGSKGSTSGRLMPEFYIRKNFNAAPNRIFSRVGFSGDHSRTIALVQSGAYQVGAVNFKVWDNEMKAGRIDPAKVSVIWKTPTYPDYQWTIRGDVAKKWGTGFADRVRQALLDLKAPDLLAAFPRKSFIPASNADYDPIRRTGLAIGILD
jgi:phosphonate transport system substrate-binding protein